MRSERIIMISGNYSQLHACPTHIKEERWMEVCVECFVYSVIVLWKNAHILKVIVKINKAS